MSTIQIDPLTGDLAVSANNLVLVESDAEVAQRVACRLRAILGEWFLDTARGVDYFGVVWVKGMPDSIIAATIKREILSVPGVVELQSFDLALEPATRRLTVSFDALSTDGAVISGNEVLI